MITKKTLIALSICFTFGSCVTQIKCMQKAGSDEANRVKMAKWLEQTSYPVVPRDRSGKKIKVPTLNQFFLSANLEILNIDFKLHNMADPRGELKSEFTENDAGLLVARRLNLGAMINGTSVVTEAIFGLRESKKA